MITIITTIILIFLAFSMNFFTAMEYKKILKLNREELKYIVDKCDQRTVITMMCLILSIILLCADLGSKFK